jgi:ribosomal protein L14
MRFISYLVRPGVFLVFGLTLGYCYGYSDAFRESDTIGSRVTRVVKKMTPEEMRAEQQRRASIVRDTIRARSGAGIVIP